MHSPNIYAGPALGVRGTNPYGYPEARSPAREPSTKILQSILYNFAQNSRYLTDNVHGEGRGAREREVRERSKSRERESLSPRYRSESPRDRYRMEHVSPPVFPLQRPPAYLSPIQRSVYESPPMLPRYYPAPSATITSQNRSREPSQPYPETYMSPRNRSSSIGSAGSSFRDSRSPSHDSTASRDSASRCSPMSIGSSPSPSPPTLESGSKLLGILKGGQYAYPFPTTNRLPEPPLLTRPGSATSIRSRHSTVSESTSGPPSLKRELPSPSNSINNKKQKVNGTSQCQDEPIDLSCKPKRQRLDSVERPTGSPSVDSGWGSDYNTSSLDDNRSSPTNETTRKSILESILCGRVSSASRERPRSNVSSPAPKIGTPPRFDYNGVVKREQPSPFRDNPSPFMNRTPPDSPCSAKSLQMSAPPSPVPSVGSQISMMSSRTRCPWRQSVTLAKKNLLPVSARVSDWLVKIVNFANHQAEFAGLPDTDKVTLMKHCWTRLMLLFMAETNFHFAVTPVHDDMDDGRPPAISGLDPSEPTMDSVELVQNFIKKCQHLCLDPVEFKCLRMYTLFHTGCSGLENAGFVENISSATRQELQDHIKKAYPEDKLRYSNLLLYLHTLFGVNCGMVQTLFCKHLMKDKDIDEHIEQMVLKRTLEDSEGEAETESTDRTASPSSKSNFAH